MAHINQFWTTNSIFRNHCLTFNVGVLQSDIQNCAVSGPLSTVLEQCDVYKIQYGYYWLKMFASFLHQPGHCSDKVFNYIGFVSNLSAVTSALMLGIIDLYPNTLVLTEYSTKTYFIATVQAPTHYYFYANSDGEQSLFTKWSQATFLIAPFHRLTWLCVLISVAVGVVLHTQTGRLNGFLRRVSVSDRVCGLCLIPPLVMVGVIYSSLLKALVINTSPSSAFRSLNELADRLKWREIEILLESNNTQRYNVLTDRTFARTDEMKRLVRQIGETPGSLRILNGMEAVCDELERTSNTVFLGYEEMVVDTCKELCFWRFPLNAIADSYSTFWMAKSFNDTMANLAALATFAMPNYGQVLVRRKLRRKRCIDGKRVTNKLSMVSLLFALILIVFGWILASGLFAVEICCFWLRDARLPLHI